MKHSALKHQALSTLISNPDQLWTDWLNCAVPSKQRAQLEYALLNRMMCRPVSILIGGTTFYGVWVWMSNG
jgi:hypothetical protein